MTGAPAAARIAAREHGTTGPLVLLLHGGPGAPGYVAPVARALSDRFRVLEPFQRGSGVTPLTVARHVEDLKALLDSLGAAPRPALVGHSWGAMLALAFAAAHPGHARGVALVGCGTFDAASRRRLEATREARLDASLRGRLAGLPATVPEPDERLRVSGQLLLGAYSCEPIAAELELERCDARAFQESWHDMLRQQERGVYPAAFRAIREPVVMLHGAMDPHPGPMIRDSLAPHIPHLEYHEWERCGHYPWLERSCRESFFETLREWLARTANPEGSRPWA